MKRLRELGVGSLVGLLLLTGSWSQAEVEHASSDLLALAQEFREFRSPVFTSYKSRDVRSVTGVPDYAAVVQEQQEGLPNFQARLKAIDPQDWPVHDQIDYLLLRAEMDYVDWQHQVLRETATNPYFYVEQAFNSVRKEIGTYRSATVVPYNEEKADALIAAFERTGPMVEQAPQNLVLPDAAPEFGNMVVRELKDIRKKYRDSAELFAQYVPQNRRDRLMAAAKEAGAALKTYHE